MRRPRWLRPTALLAVLAVVLLAVALWRADPRDALAAAAGIPPATIAIAVGCVLAAYALRFAKWQLFLHKLAIDVPWTRSLAIFVAGLLMVVTPAKVGEVWKALALRESDGVPMPRGLAALALERLTDLLAVVSLSLLAAASFGNAPLLAALAFLAMGLGIAALRWRRPWLALLARLERRKPGSRVASFLHALYQDAHGLLRPVPIGLGGAAGILAWGLEGFALGLLLHGLGEPVAYAWAIGVFAAGTIAGVLSILPGGLGTAEAGMVGLLVAGGVDASVAFAATVLVRILTLGLGAALGGVAYVAWARRTAAASPTPPAN